MATARDRQIGVKLRKGKEEEKGGRKRSDKESLL
jgi:hypothetical protein